MKKVGKDRIWGCLLWDDLGLLIIMLNLEEAEMIGSQRTDSFPL